MSVGSPENEQTVIDNISVDVARAAPDSNPYLKVHWLRSLINGFGRRVFDFYPDLRAAEKRLMPDTADETTAPRWGAIYGKTKNPATQASGNIVAQGVAASIIPLGTTFAAGASIYTSTASGTISAQIVNVSTITRSGTVATVTTVSDHGLASAVPVTIAGAVETDYNLTDVAITVTGLDTFTYSVAGSPSTPATGTITAAFTSASVPVTSDVFGSTENLELDTPLTLQSPIIGVNDALNVDFGAIGGGTDQETNTAFKARYIDRIRNPIAHFSESEIIDKAKEISGVTRVFPFAARSTIGTVTLSTLTRAGQVATATTAAPHGFESGEITDITGAVETDYNVVDAIIIVESTTIFHYVVPNSPTTPATGTILATTSIPMGQVRTYFMRDDDAGSSIPTGSEVAQVKALLDTIKPANTSTVDNQVLSPTALPENFVFTALLPTTATMKTAVENNLQQFFDEQTTVGTDVDEDLYRAAIANTVDTETGDTVQSFDLSTPSGDLPASFGQIATLGTVTIP